MKDLHYWRAEIILVMSTIYVYLFLFYLQRLWSKISRDFFLYFLFQQGVTLAHGLSKQYLLGRSCGSQSLRLHLTVCRKSSREMKEMDVCLHVFLFCFRPGLQSMRLCHLQLEWVFLLMFIETLPEKHSDLCLLSNSKIYQGDNKE